ncbi:hypothetical protein AXG93_2817s1280 [Marchantia polymorpha subsp. ruderalis]|uniref:Uncharacterized protein n=1 Tax=Marchantia polymorpha subsp. ruderalis TaxID=1480154 RepID=A0A176W3V6_MARPO|nr:hypothetical protein AXG93_2817s1280 [Marchantia polymorpha subsp. ruderalis]
MEVVFPMPRTALRCAEDVSQYSNKSLGSMAPFLKLHAAEASPALQASATLVGMAASTMLATVARRILA